MLEKSPRYVTSVPNFFISSARSFDETEPSSISLAAYISVIITLSNLFRAFAKSSNKFNVLLFFSIF